MTRGDLVTIALQGEQGKPRPALVIQADQFGDLPAVTVLPLTSTSVDAPLFRIGIRADKANGLSRDSYVQVDKPTTPLRSKVGPVFGRVGDATMLSVSRALTVFLGLA